MLLYGESDQLELPLGDPFWLTRMGTNAPQLPVLNKRRFAIAQRGLAIVMAEILDRAKVTETTEADPLGQSLQAAE